MYAPKAFVETERDVLFDLLEEYSIAMFLDTNGCLAMSRAPTRATRRRGEHGLVTEAAQHGPKPLFGLAADAHTRSVGAHRDLPATVAQS